MVSFFHTNLSQEELQFGGKLGLDYWDDTSSSGKHSYVEEFVEGCTITATGLTSVIRSMKDLHIKNLLYAYDTTD